MARADPQAGLHNRLALEGQIIQHTEEGNPMYVLGQMKWATLAWPLLVSDDRAPHFYLDETKGCEWLHIHAPGAWFAYPTDPVWSEDFGLCFRKSGALESLTQNSLRRSQELSFNDLRLLAGKDMKSRADLLTSLASQFGKEFCDQVLEQDRDSKPKKTVSDSHGALVKAVLEYLDDDERKEFKDVRDDVLKSEKAKVQKKWRDLLNQKTEEQKETYLMMVIVLNQVVSPNYVIYLFLVGQFIPNTSTRCAREPLRRSVKRKRQRAKGRQEPSQKEKAKARARAKARRGREVRPSLARTRRTMMMATSQWRL